MSGSWSVIAHWVKDCRSRMRSALALDEAVWVAKWVERGTVSLDDVACMRMVVFAHTKSSQVQSSQVKL